MTIKAACRIFILFSCFSFAAGSFAQADTVQIVGFGDSLMAGYELAPSDAFPSKLEAALKAEGYDVAISNAGVSGDTSTSGLARINWSVPEGTDAVLLQLGANDALRGLSPENTRQNLDAMIAGLQKRGIAVLLVGMLAPPNMGDDYAERFNTIYPELAEARAVPLYPFFLDGVAAQSGLDIGDGMHPNPKGVDIMVARFLPYAEDLIASINGQTSQ